MFTLKIRKKNVNSITQSSTVRNQKKKQTKLKASRQQEIIKIIVEINEITGQKNYRVNNTKNWFFVKINKIDKPLPRMTKERRKAQITIITGKVTLLPTLHN